MPWITACALDEVEMEEAVRVDHAGRSYAIFLTEDGGLRFIRLEVAKKDIYE